MNNMIKNKAREGKKKREIKFIDAKGSRQVTFTKRRVGVFSKASELCVLTGAEAVVLCESIGGRVYAFGHPSVESVVDKYLGDKSSSELLENDSAASETNVNFPSCMREEFNKQHKELTKEMQTEKNKSEKVTGRINDNFANDNMEEGDLFWWQQPFEHLEEEELDDYISSMEELMNKLKLRANDLMLIRSSSSTFDASNTWNFKDSGLTHDQHAAHRNLDMKDYGLPNELFANKNMTVMDYGLPDEFFANKNMTTKDYGLADANKNMTRMDYGLPHEWFLNKNLTTKNCGPPDEHFANKNMTMMAYGSPDKLLASKNMTAIDYGLPDEFSVNKNLTTKDPGLPDECYANKNLNFNDDGLLDELLAIKDPDLNDELDDYFTDLELPLDYGNNLQVPNIGCNGVGNEVQLSQTDSNLAVPDNYAKASDLQNFGTDVFPHDFSFSRPPNC